jgi:propane monooxygenase coupling protein
VILAEELRRVTRLHTDNIFKPMKDIQLENTVSHECGVTMNESVESRAIAEVMTQVQGMTVTYMPAMIRIDGTGRLIFKMSEISEVLGRTMTPHLFEICISTHYGRMFMIDDDTVALLGDLDEALKYIE